MRTKRRWLNWVLAEADRFDVAMPWERRVRSGNWKRRLSAATKKLAASA